MRHIVPILCLLSAACAATRPVHYYVIHQPAAAAPAAKPDGLVILVGHIATPEALQDARIRYRSGPNEVGSYEFHRWTERPGPMVRELLVRTLRASGKYRQVQEAASAAAPGDYLLRGKLHDFSEVDDPGIQTRVSLQLELVDRKSGLVVWDRHFDRDEPVGGKDMKQVVASLDHNLQAVVGEASAAIDTFLSGAGRGGQ